MSHTLRMLVGCLLPFMLIFALPVFGASEELMVFLFIALLFGCHLLITGSVDHSRHGPGDVRKGDHHADT